MKCGLYWGSKWVSDFSFAIISGFRAFGERLVVTFITQQTHLRTAENMRHATRLSCMFS